MNRVRGAKKHWITESALRHTCFFVSWSEDARICFSFLSAQGQTPWILMILLPIKHIILYSERARACIEQRP